MKKAFMSCRLKPPRKLLTDTQDKYVASLCMCCNKRCVHKERKSYLLCFENTPAIN